jgi:MoxR-like ATPase/Mg-chelatase subunit ChlD
MKPKLTPRLMARVDRDVVGLRREAEVLCAALAANRHVVLEGPPGAGKSTLLRAVAEEAGIGLLFVEGNAELTPARLVGHHDPALVLQTGYRNEAFVEGPLLRAMREGLLLYVEELNRVPEETLNVLITALAEGEIHVPRVGMVEAVSGFRLVAAMNPFDAVGTARIGQAIYDRLCRITIPYQDEPGERRIVARATGVASTHAGLAVAIGRASREHPDVRMGSSVRGAIDMVHLAEELRRIRAEPAASRETLLDAALAAFTGRIRLDESCERQPEEVITEIFDQLVDPTPNPHPPRGTGRGGGQAAGNTAGRRVLEGKDAAGALREGSRRTRGRDEMAAAHSGFERISPALGRLDEEAFDNLRRSDPDAATSLLADLVTATDRELRRRARRLAARVFVGLARAGPRHRRGYRRMVSRAGAATGDVDLDGTLERAGGRPRRPEDLVLRDWRSAERAACLLLDHSGSMRGHGLALAAVAAASVALAADGRADCSVVAFNNDAIVLKAQGRRRALGGLVSDILSLRAGGTTDLELALRAAAAQLARADAPERVAIVMSDCLATTGGDPLAAMSGIDRLHVLGTSADQESVASGRALAGRARGRYVPAATFAQVTRGLAALLA